MLLTVGETSSVPETGSLSPDHPSDPVHVVASKTSQESVEDCDCPDSIVSGSALKSISGADAPRGSKTAKYLGSVKVRYSVPETFSHLSEALL